MLPGGVLRQQFDCKDADAEILWSLLLAAGCRKMSAADLLHPVFLTPDCKMTETHFKIELFVVLKEGNVLVLVAASCGVCYVLSLHLL